MVTGTWMVTVEVTGTRMLMGQMTGTVEGDGGSDRGADGGNEGGADNELRNGRTRLRLLTPIIWTTMHWKVLSGSPWVEAHRLREPSLRAVNTLFNLFIPEFKNVHSSNLSEEMHINEVLRIIGSDNYLPSEWDMKSQVVHTAVYNE